MHLEISGLDGVPELPFSQRLEVAEHVASNGAAPLPQGCDGFLQWLHDCQLATRANGKLALTEDGAVRLASTWTLQAPSRCLAIAGAPCADSTRWHLMQHLGVGVQVLLPKEGFGRLCQRLHAGQREGLAGQVEQIQAPRAQRRLPPVLALPCSCRDARRASAQQSIDRARAARAARAGDLSICLSIYLYIHIFISLSIHLSIDLPIDLFYYLSI